jgi:hypothetical protein
MAYSVLLLDPGLFRRKRQAESLNCILNVILREYRSITSK